MVKFGGHVEAIREYDLGGSGLYLIPYNKIKTLINEHRGKEDLQASMLNPIAFDPNVSLVFNGEYKQADGDLAEDEVFTNIWKKALNEAENDFHKARQEIWQTVFAGIAAHDDTVDSLVRGAHPGNAIKLYVDLANTKGNSAAAELLDRMKQIHQAASVNAEALRKLVKKFDKHGTHKELSSRLLPTLYTSALYSGQNMIRDSICLLRELMDGGFDDADANGDEDIDLFDRQHFQPLARRDSEARHKEAVDVRVAEFNWLKHLVKTIPARGLLPHLVAHRGFHSIKDFNDRRPVENSLSAYEMAWTCGIELCECDIALTKDEKLVLAHDENFFRLSLDQNDKNSKRKVSDLTFKELISMPLTSGVRPPLLIDVLRSATAISERSKLVIEIKPGNEASAYALSRMLIRHPDLRSSVAMIMSFDAATMHILREELDRSILPDSRDYSNTDTGMPMHRRVTSYDHFGTMSSAWLGGMAASRSNLASTSNFNSMNLSSIGLSISQSNLNNQPQQTNPSQTKLELETIPGDESMHMSANLGDLHKSACLEWHDRCEHNMPKLMLLTVADPPNIPCELQVQYNELNRVDGWLSTQEGTLDGVYLQYEKEMMTPEGAAHLRELSKRYMVGIWAYADRDPDDYETFKWLVEEGNCSFVNTDLPTNFRKDLDDFVQKS